MPDRFANGDVTNDSSKYTFEKANRKLKGGRHGGDIQGIINHLDYIKQLGATAIWSTPLLEDNQSVYSYHGYAITNPYKIDPRYGTNELYKNLVEKAHKKGIKLIMDYVTNHWGSNNWIIKDLPTYSWIHQFPISKDQIIECPLSLIHMLLKLMLNFAWMDGLIKLCQI